MFYISDGPISMPSVVDGVDNPDVDMNGFAFHVNEGLYIPIAEEADPIQPPYREPRDVMGL